MADSRWNGRCRRAGDKLLTFARIEALILIGLVPVAAMVAEVFTDWRLSGEWVTMYCVGVVGGAATLFGLAKRGKP